MGAPHVAFLGVTERVQYRRRISIAGEHDIIGLRNVIASAIYPVPISGLHVALAVFDPASFTNAKIELLRPDKTVLATMEFNIKPVPVVPGDEPQRGAGHAEYATFATPSPVWVFMACQLANDPAAYFPQPGNCDVVLVTPDGRQQIGVIVFGLIDPSPLTPERIAAMKSDPLATKSVEVHVNCRLCNSDLKGYVSLDRDDSKHKGIVWHADLPERFICDCKKTNTDLQYIKKNLHGLLGTRASGSNMSTTRLYEQTALHEIVRKFGALLDSKPNEEVMQRFLQENPLLFSQFAPERIFFKSPILTKYKTDFTIATHKKSLLLVEIERPSLKLVTKSGDMSADLQHAYGQAHNWLHEVRSHRHAILDSLKIRGEDIGQIKGVVIAGRDKDHSAEHLLRLRARDQGEIDFYTYDDILRAVRELVNQVSQI